MTQRDPCCEDWEDGIGQVDSAIQLADNHGAEFDFPSFKFCPWCGAERWKPHPKDIPDVVDEKVDGDVPGEFEWDEGREVLVWSCESPGLNYLEEREELEVARHQAVHAVSPFLRDGWEITEVGGIDDYVHFEIGREE